MTIAESFALPPLAEEQLKQALLDMGAIIRGEEMELPWRRLRLLLDRYWVEIKHPVITAGSRTSLGVSEVGLEFMDDYLATRGEAK